ncbi:MAG: xylulokinase [Paracoccaceae bacterium]
MYIGLDLGTSGLRALLTDAEGAPIGSATSDYNVSHPHAGWSEQNPSDWITALGACLAQLKADHSDAFDVVRGISFSGHMHGAVVLNKDGEVLRPCILWNDTRAHVEAAKLDQMAGVRDISGNIVFPGFTAPKLAWMKANEPDLFDQVATVMLPKDYLSFWLTGRRVTDMSDAAGSAWLDVSNRRWSADLVAASDMNERQMPELLEGTDVVGQVLPDRAATLGLNASVQVVAGGADNAVAACGVGALGEGVAFVSLGTSGVLLSGRDRCAPSPQSAVHTFCHAVPGHWYQMGVNLAATDCLNWLSRISGQTPEALSDAAGDTLQAPTGVRFYPYLSGERTPHNDSQIRAGFTGLDVGTEIGDMSRAVMEGVSFALRDSYEALKSTGLTLDGALAIGGGTRSRIWTEILATTLNLPLHRPAQGEFGAALGAARLAICGVTDVTPESLMSRPPIADTIEPNQNLIAAFDDAYQAFRAGYPKLKALQ